MNISPLTIYLWQLADRTTIPSVAITSLAGLAAFLLFIILIINISDVAKLSASDDTYDVKRNAKELASAKALVQFVKAWLKGSIAIGAITLCFSVLIPSSNTIAMMVIIPKIADSKVIQQDLPDVYNAAISALKAAITPKLPEVKK